MLGLRVLASQQNPEPPRTRSITKALVSGVSLVYSLPLWLTVSQTEPPLVLLVIRGGGAASSHFAEMAAEAVVDTVFSMA